EHDQVVTPFVRQFYSGPDVTNTLLQENCAVDRSEHIATLYSERSLRSALNAIEPGDPAPVECFPVAPFAPWVTQVGTGGPCDRGPATGPSCPPDVVRPGRLELPRP